MIQYADLVRLKKQIAEKQIELIESELKYLKERGVEPVMNYDTETWMWPSVRAGGVVYTHLEDRTSALEFVAAQESGDVEFEVVEPQRVGAR